jgi:signal peptidase II
MISSGPPIRVFGDILRIAFVENPNAVFGFSLGSSFPFELVTILAIALIVFLIIKESQFTLSLIFGLLLGGALGNLIDRMRFGMVTDFIDVGLSKTLRWPVFNVADSAVTVGLTIFVIMTIFRRKPTEEQDVGHVEAQGVQDDNVG